jgi:hypothetical protein
MKKLYEGIASSRSVYVHPEYEPKHELEHHVHHSPDGFSWGYLGSGCAELARCILWDHLGFEPQPALYQKFKEDYIARFRMDQNWILGSEAIEAWLELNKEVAH